MTSVMRRVLGTLTLLAVAVPGTTTMAAPPYHQGGYYHHYPYYHHHHYHHYYHNYVPYTPTAYNAYYPPAAVSTAPRYYVPAEYAGTAAGYVISWGGANYLSNGDGTMSPYAGPVAGQ